MLLIKKGELSVWHNLEAQVFYLASPKAQVSFCPIPTLGANTRRHTPEHGRESQSTEKGTPGKVKEGVGGRLSLLKLLKLEVVR